MAIALSTVKSPSDGSLPVSSEPADPTKSLVNKPTVQAAAPTALPVSPTAATPASDVGKAPASTNTVAAPATAPTPYQTTDPLAFLPSGDTSGGVGTALTPSIPTPVSYYNDPTSQIATAPTGSTITEGTGLLGGSTTPTTPAAPTTSSNGTVSLTPTDPSTALTNSTITPGPAVDRFAIANDELSQWDAASQPQFDRQIQTLAQNAAGRGQIGSGTTRGSFADASTNYQNQRTTAQRGFLTDALNGSIDDAYKNIGIAQQQQGFQASQGQNAFTNQVTLQQLADSEQGQSFQQQMAAQGFNATQIQQAFDNAYKVQQLSDDETGQAFYRALQQYIQGTSGDPTQIEEWLAGLYALPQGA